MGRSQETWNKQEKEKIKQRKRDEKLKRKEMRQDRKGGSLDDMIAWVDADGNPTSTPPDPNAKKAPEINVDDIIIGVRPKEESDEETINEGTLSFFDESKGYGFIKVKNSSDSIFTHVKSHLEPLKEGNHVQFDIASGDKGPVAINVKVIR